MINGSFFFVNSQISVARGPVEVTSIDPYMRTTGFSSMVAKESISRVYAMITGNRMAADPWYVVTPGVRPMTSCTEPWLHASGYTSTSSDPCPMYRERISQIDIVYGENGVCKAEVATKATTGLVKYGMYFNNVGMYPPAARTPASID